MVNSVADFIGPPFRFLYSERFFGAFKFPFSDVTNIRKNPEICKHFSRFFLDFLGLFLWHLKDDVLPCKR